MGKRLLDLCFTLPVTLILLPLLTVIALAIKLTSKGPIIFKQQRTGKNGAPFTVYKFRTMRVGGDPFGASPRSGDDPRLTSIGKILREYSLDELPQLVNILQGNMSLVGPRPLYESQAAEWTDHQRQRLKVKPGLTGLAQIQDRAALTIEDKLELDVAYVRQQSFWLDIKILLRTFSLVWNKEGIYEKRYSRTEETRREKNPTQNPKQPS